MWPAVHIRFSDEEGEGAVDYLFTVGLIIAAIVVLYSMYTKLIG